MKKRLLILLPAILLVGCNNQETPTPDPEPEPTPVTFEEKLASMTGNLKIQGTLSYKFYENGEPTATDPVTTELTLFLTSNGYEISYNGEFDETFTETLFKSENNNVELRYINELNELVIKEAEDKDGNKYDFTHYTNPFTRMEASYFNVSEDNMSAEFMRYTEEEETRALDFVSTFTYYTFPEIDKFTFTCDENTITGIQIQTPVLQETMRQGVYSFDLKVVGKGESVKDLETPAPAEPNEQQKLLETALKELDEGLYQANLQLNLGYMTYNMTAYKNADGIVVIDNDEPQFSSGFFKFEDQFYEISYDRKNKTFQKQLSTTLTEEDIKTSWTYLSSALFDVSEDGKTFTVSSKLPQDFIRKYVYDNFKGNPAELAGTDSFSFTLDENNKVKTLTLDSSTTQMYETSTVEFTVGTCTLPFDLATIPTVE